eukprot:Pgem_evm1s7305
MRFTTSSTAIAIFAFCIQLCNSAPSLEPNSDLDKAVGRERRNIWDYDCDKGDDHKIIHFW